MITIIYPYKNKELDRLHKSLESLEAQENQDFEVLIIDYGSDFDKRDFNKKELSIYKKVKYIYSYHIHQPWSRPRAINIGVKHCETEYVFTADIDMIFRKDFTQLLHNLKDPKKSYYFKVGYLSEQDSKKELKFNQYKPMHFSEKSAQGISLFPRQELLNINGLDEYIHFWGADNDIHNRLENNGLGVFFYDEEVLIMHQWHKIYANEEKDILTKKLQLSYISRINQRLQDFNLENNIRKTNIRSNWGQIITKNQFELIEKSKETIYINSVREDVFHFIYVQLPRFNNGVLNVTFNQETETKQLKYRIKKIIGKKVFNYLSLKEINDLLLTHLISFYKNCPYTLIIADDLKSINFKILKK